MTTTELNYNEYFERLIDTAGKSVTKTSYANGLTVTSTYVYADSLKTKLDFALFRESCAGEEFYWMEQ